MDKVPTMAIEEVEGRAEILAKRNYGDTNLWSLYTIDFDTEDYSNTGQWELADGTITSRVGAASLAASFGGTAGVSVAGAGAVATNIILTKTNAYVKDSSLNT